jgi:methionyl-tRNA formyltransferase
MIKILYFGTAQIAADVLRKLTQLNVEVVGVVSQPDREGNRKQIQATPVKAVALENSLKLFQPIRPSEIINEIKELKPDLIITCAYGAIIGESILYIPKYKCVNIHASLLPKLRGAAPIQYAILNNDKETGVTLMYMDKSMDTGDIIVQEKIAINPKETYSSLYNKLTTLAIKMIHENIDKLTQDNVKHYPQDNAQATYTNKITKDDEKIN